MSSFPFSSFEWPNIPTHRECLEQVWEEVKDIDVIEVVGFDEDSFLIEEEDHHTNDQCSYVC